MATREEFGKYLLLKKLSEDPLGETFRAGRVGSQGMEQVVLLRALNGPRLDTARLAGALPERAAVQQGLKSPNIGNGVDLGDVKGVPYVAYDYISGKNLATLLAEADKQGSPISLDHALLISERIAQALAVAYETRLGDQRLLHGFVVPPFVRISNEGETRLLGFEVGSLLQEMAGRGIFEPAISSYLAPEILAGEAAAKSDDVYSLGALLFQLLTGNPPSANEPGGLVQEIDRAVVAAEETPIPAPLATLLKKSLTPRDNRIPEAVSWHKALSKIMVEGQYNATTFNLAFFMHNLFRAEIERETQELEAEKKIKADEAMEPPPMPAAESRPAYDTVITDDSELSDGGEGGSKTGLWIGIAAVLLIGAAAGWYFWMGPGAALLRPTPEPVQEEATVQPPAPEPVDLPPSPLDDPEIDAEAEAEQAEAEAEELQERIQQMISDSNQNLEAKFKAQYEAQIKELQQQLSNTQAAADKAREDARKQQEAETATQEPDETEDTRRAATEPANSGTTTSRDGNAGPDGSPSTSQPSQPASSGPDPSQERIADRPSTDGTGGSDTSSQPAQSAPTQPPSSRPTTPAQTQTTPPDPPQVTPPEILRQPQARYPEIARRMGRQATVLLRVLVDDQGRVVDVERIGKRVGTGFDEAATEAARQARYKPGTEDGRPKSMWTTLRIEFRPPS